MVFTRAIVNQKRFKITESGTFTIEPKEVVKSAKFKKMIKTLKPVSELNKK